MNDSVFTRIIKGELPSHKVYEDELVYAFMDIAPVQPGMIVIVSKQQTDNFEDLPENTAVAMMRVSQKLMRALKKTFPNKPKVTLQIEGLDVPHAHIKLFPIASAADLRARPPEGEPDHDVLEDIAKKIRGNI